MEKIKTLNRKWNDLISHDLDLGGRRHQACLDGRWFLLAGTSRYIHIHIHIGVVGL